MTINKLKEQCEAAIKKGLGNREIYVANDEEGNGYHALPAEIAEDYDALEMGVEQAVRLILEEGGEK